MSLGQCVAMAKVLILTGVALVLIGLIMVAAQRFGLARLPGDIVIERDGFTLYIPLATSMLVSVILTLLLWLLGPLINAQGLSQRAGSSHQ